MDDYKLNECVLKDEKITAKSKFKNREIQVNPALMKSLKDFIYIVSQDLGKTPDFSISIFSHEELDLYMEEKEKMVNITIQPDFYKFFGRKKDNLIFGDNKYSKSHEILVDYLKNF